MGDIHACTKSRHHTAGIDECVLEADDGTRLPLLVAPDATTMQRWLRRRPVGTAAIWVQVSAAQQRSRVCGAVGLEAAATMPGAQTRPPVRAPVFFGVRWKCAARVYALGQGVYAELVCDPDGGSGGSGVTRCNASQRTVQLLNALHTRFMPRVSRFVADVCQDAAFAEDAPFTDSPPVHAVPSRYYATARHEQFSTVLSFVRLDDVDETHAPQVLHVFINPSTARIWIEPVRAGGQQMIVTAYAQVVSAFMSPIYPYNIIGTDTLSASLLLGPQGRPCTPTAAAQNALAVRSLFLEAMGPPPATPSSTSSGTNTVTGTTGTTAAAVGPVQTLDRLVGAVCRMDVDNPAVFIKIALQTVGASEDTWGRLLLRAVEHLRLHCSCAPVMCLVFVLCDRPSTFPVHQQIFAPVLDVFERFLADEPGRELYEANYARITAVLAGEKDPLAGNTAAAALSSSGSPTSPCCSPTTDGSGFGSGCATPDGALPETPFRSVWSLKKAARSLAVQYAMADAQRMEEYLVRWRVEGRVPLPPPIALETKVDKRKVVDTFLIDHRRRFLVYMYKTLAVLLRSGDGTTNGGNPELFVRAAKILHCRVYPFFLHKRPFNKPAFLAIQPPPPSSALEKHAFWKAVLSQSEKHDECVLKERSLRSFGHGRAPTRVVWNPGFLTITAAFLEQARTDPPRDIATLLRILARCLKHNTTWSAAERVFGMCFDHLTAMTAVLLARTPAESFQQAFRECSDLAAICEVLNLVSLMLAQVQHIDTCDRLLAFVMGADMQQVVQRLCLLAFSTSRRHEDEETGVHDLPQVLWLRTRLLRLFRALCRASMYVVHKEETAAHTACRLQVFGTVHALLSPEWGVIGRFFFHHGTILVDLPNKLNVLRLLADFLPYFTFTGASPYTFFRQFSYAYLIGLFIEAFPRIRSQPECGSVARAILLLFSSAFHNLPQWHDLLRETTFPRLLPFFISLEHHIASAARTVQPAPSSETVQHVYEAICSASPMYVSDEIHAVILYLVMSFLLVRHRTLSPPVQLITPDMRDIAELRFFRAHLNHPSNVRRIPRIMPMYLPLPTTRYLFFMRVFLTTTMFLGQFSNPKTVAHSPLCDVLVADVNVSAFSASESHDESSSSHASTNTTDAAAAAAAAAALADPPSLLPGEMVSGDCCTPSGTIACKQGRVDGDRVILHKFDGIKNNGDILDALFTELTIHSLFGTTKGIDTMYDFGASEDNYWSVFRCHTCSLHLWRQQQGPSPVWGNGFLAVVFAVYDQVVDAMQLFEDNFISHFELQTHNVLLTASTSDGEPTDLFWHPYNPRRLPFDVTLSNFSSDHIHCTNEQEYMRYARCTLPVQSPEFLAQLVKQCPDRTAFPRAHRVLYTNCSKSSSSAVTKNVWPLACLLYELITGEFLFQRASDAETVRAVCVCSNDEDPADILDARRVHLLHHCDPLLAFFRAVLVRDEQKRPSFAQFRQMYETMRTAVLAVLPSDPDDFDMPSSSNSHTQMLRKKALKKRVQFDTLLPTDAKACLWAQELWYQATLTDIVPGVFLGAIAALSPKLMTLTQKCITHLVDCCDREHEPCRGVIVVRMRPATMHFSALRQCLSDILRFVRAALLQKGRVLIVSDTGANFGAVVAAVVLANFCAVTVWQAFALLRRKCPAFAPHPALVDYVEALTREFSATLCTALSGAPRRTLAGGTASTQLMPAPVILPRAAFRCLCGSCIMRCAQPLDPVAICPCACTATGSTTSTASTTAPHIAGGCSTFCHAFAALGFRATAVSWGMTTFGTLRMSTTYLQNLVEQFVLPILSSSLSCFTHLHLCSRVLCFEQLQQRSRVLDARVVRVCVPRVPLCGLCGACRVCGAAVHRHAAPAAPRCKHARRARVLHRLQCRGPRRRRAQLRLACTRRARLLRRAAPPPCF